MASSTVSLKTLGFRIWRRQSSMQSYSHPCGPWSRAKPESGNEFVHFSIRAIRTAQAAKRRGFRVMSVMEHPEDLCRIRNGCRTCVKHGSVPASTWQLPELRSAYGEFPSTTAAGHQCQFEGVDRAKPTMLYSDIMAMAEFGHEG